MLVSFWIFHPKTGLASVMMLVSFWDFSSKNWLSISYDACQFLGFFIQKLA
jgi:hypothetical protein